MLSLPLQRGYPSAPHHLPAHSPWDAHTKEEAVTLGLAQGHLGTTVKVSTIKSVSCCQSE